MENGFGQRVRDLRLARRISLRRLAGIVGIDFTYLSKIENGKARPPSNEVIEKLARELNVDQEDLFALAARVSQADLRREVEKNPGVGALMRALQSGSLSQSQVERMLRIARDPEGV